MVTLDVTGTRKEKVTMNDEETPDVEDIKIRLGDEIPVEEETTYKAQTEESEVVDELRNLGQQFANTLRAAWFSEERKQFEQEMREGVQTFAQEVDKAVKDIASSEAAKKAKTEAEEIKTKADASDVAEKTRSGLAHGLRRFSEELSKLADSFTPVEKQPPSEDE